MSNQWLWFHILGGGVLAKIFQLFLAPQMALLGVLIIAIAWEVFEYLKDDVVSIYGSKKRFFKDALQDVMGAFLMAAIAVI